MYIHILTLHTYITYMYLHKCIYTLYIFYKLINVFVLTFLIGSRLSYVAGDHVAIYPVNDAESVTRIGELLNTDLDTVVTLTNVDGE